MANEYQMRSGLGADDASRDLSEALNGFFTKHGPNGIFKTCGNCKHMVRAGAAHCSLYKMTPPVAVIIAGCPSHDDDNEIPF